MATTRQRTAPPVGEILGDPPNPPNGSEWRAPVVPGGLSGPMPEPDEDEEADDATERIRAMLAAAGSDQVRVKVYRTDPRTARLQWCCDQTSHEFEAGGLESIREAWGAGEFEVRVIGPRGILGRMRFAIAKPLDNPAPMATAQVAGTDPQLAMILGKIAESQALLMQMVSKPAPPPPDPMAQMQLMMGVMRDMREALGLNVPPPPPPPASDPATMLGTLVNAFKTMKEAAQEFGPKGEPEESLTGLAGKVIDMVGPQLGQALPQLLQGSASAPAAMPGVALPPSFAMGAAPSPELIDNPQPSAPEAPTLPETMETLILRGTLQGLVDLGVQGKPAQEGGEYIAEKLPDDLLPYLDLPNWHDLLKMAARMVGVTLPDDLLPWLTEARACAIAELSKPDAD